MLLVCLGNVSIMLATGLNGGGGGLAQLGDIWVVDSNVEALDIVVGEDVEVHVVVLTGQVFKPEYQSLSEPGWSVFIRQIR